MDASFFHANGYQIFERVLPLDLIEDIRKVLEEDAQRSLAVACKETGCKDEQGVLAKVDAIAKGADGTVDKLSKAARDAFSGHISLETRLSPALRTIPIHPNLQAVARVLLNSGRLFMHMPPTARFVLPGNVHAAVPPHQDVTYNKHINHFVVIWVPLVDIDEECGGVSIYRGSAVAPEQPVTQSPKDFWQSGVSTAGFEPLHCKMKRGDVLAFGKWTVHASMPNTSNRTRYSVDHRFFGESENSTKHFLDLQTNEIIAPSELRA